MVTGIEHLAVRTTVARESNGSQDRQGTQTGYLQPTTMGSLISKDDFSGRYSALSETVSRGGLADFTQIRLLFSLKPMITTESDHMFQTKF